jgi:hypothetical protein
MLLANVPRICAGLRSLLCPCSFLIYWTHVCICKYPVSFSSLMMFFFKRKFSNVDKGSPFNVDDIPHLILIVLLVSVNSESMWWQKTAIKSVLVVNKFMFYQSWWNLHRCEHCLQHTQKIYFSVHRQCLGPLWRLRALA